MATYVNDLRLKEIGTGESSGTWGTETNVNLELIGEALSFGTEGITTNADTHTSTVADGSTDPARSMYIKYTGTLDSACTITIAPNTLSRLHFIENGTSGSQNIIISQGSGANVTIPPGDVKVVYLDGAGSGAAVVDAFASLNVVDLKVEDDLTVTDDLIVNGDIDLEGSIDVNGTANLDVVDIDGAVDMASTLQVDGAITSSAGATITVADNSDVLTLVSTDTDANGGPFLVLSRTSSSSAADNDVLGVLNFNGLDDANATTTYAQQFAMIEDASNGSEDGMFILKTIVAGAARSRMAMNSASGTVFNEDGQDLDFRVESSSNTSMLHVDASTNKVGINTSAGDGLLHVQSATAGTVEADAEADELVLESSGNTGLSLLMPSDGLSSILFGNPGTNGQKDGAIRYYGETHSTTANRRNLVFSTGNSEAMRLDSNQRMGVGTSAPADPLHVAGNFRVSTTTADGTELRLKVTPGGAGDNGTVALYQDDGSTAGVFIQADGASWFTGGINPGSGDTTAANVLDDYEEGTWTPTIFGGSSAGTYQLEAARTGGVYTKVGRIVHVSAVLRISSIDAAGSGSLNFGGLPFTLGPNLASAWGEGGNFQVSHYGAGVNSSASTYPPPFTGIGGGSGSSTFTINSFGKNYQVTSVIGDLSATSWIYIISGSYYTSQ